MVGDRRLNYFILSNAGSIQQVASHFGTNTTNLNLGIYYLNRRQSRIFILATYT
jgi:hypothetical protein